MLLHIWHFWMVCLKSLIWYTQSITSQKILCSAPKKNWGSTLKSGTHRRNILKLRQQFGISSTLPKAHVNVAQCNAVLGLNEPSGSASSKLHASHVNVHNMTEKLTVLVDSTDSDADTDHTNPDISSQAAVNVMRCNDVFGEPSDLASSKLHVNVDRQNVTNYLQIRAT